MDRDSSVCLVMGPDGYIVYVSPSFKTIFGTTDDDLIEKNLSETHLPRSFIDAMEMAIKRVVLKKKGTIISIDKCLTLGLPVYECNLSPTFYPDGTIKHIISFYTINSEKDTDALIDFFLDHILNKLQGTNDIDDAIPSVLSYISSSFNADIVTLLFRLEDQWYPKYVHGVGDSSHDVIFLEEHAALAHLVKKRKNIFSVHKNNQSSHFAKTLPISWGIQSMSAVPLHIQGEVFAILTISNRSICRPLTDYQKDSLSKIASILALAFSEDRYIWSREGGIESIRNNNDHIEVGAALLNSRDQSIIWSNKTYDDLILSSGCGGDIFNLNYYTKSERFDRIGPDEVLKMVNASSKPQMYGRVQRRSSSGIITYWQVSFMSFSVHGDAPAVLCFVINISDWENANKKVARLIHAIQEEQFRVKALLDSVPVGVYISDAEGHILEMNGKGPKIWGGDAPLPRDVEEYGDYMAWSIKTGKRMTVDDWPVVKAVRYGQVIVGEVIDYQNFDGKKGTLINSAAPIRNRNGAVIGAVEIDHDITEMKRLERDLITAKAGLEAFINQMPAGVAIAEAPSGKVISCNDELMRMCPLYLGMPQSVEDYSQWGLLNPHDLKPIPSNNYPMAIALSEKRTIVGTETVIKKSNNGYMTIISSASPVVDGEGKAIGVVSIFTDITKQKEAERRLEKQTMDLARFNADLQRFAYVTSNELRESLKSITNYLSLIDKNSS